MRDIRFRAWDKIEKRMWEPIIGRNGVLMAPNQLGGYVSYPDPQDPLMQFTGLKDKNGKEIYEGDVVNCGFFWGDDFGNEVGEMEYCKEVVKFKIGIQGSGWDFNAHGFENVEVIGNIYENPELLDNKD